MAERLPDSGGLAALDLAISHSQPQLSFLLFLRIVTATYGQKASPDGVRRAYRSRNDLIFRSLIAWAWRLGSHDAVRYGYVSPRIDRV